MLLGGKDSKDYPEILELYEKYLKENPTGHTFFGIIQDKILQAVASVRCYHTHWYFRGCVVKPEFRGKGLQRILIRERIGYLSERTNIIKVSIYPENTYSIDNVLAEGFQFEKTRKLETNEKMVNVYALKLV